MFKKLCFIALIGFILLGATTTEIPLPALLLMGGMIIPAVFIALARRQQQE